MPENSPPLEYQIFDPEHQEIRVVTIHPSKPRYWLHALLFAATIFTTLCIGARLHYNFVHNLPAFAEDTDFWPWFWVFQDWRQLALGIPFAACLLGILTAHELGHYILCLRRGVQATLPFFIPAPTLVGTMGAFIRIKSPIRSRSDLFDIGVAGPIAGFLVALPVLFFALLASRPATGSKGLILGFPWIFKLAQWILAAAGNHMAASVPVEKLSLHPTAFAAWFGMFATALNLLPGGQLDGGHIIFALNPKWHRSVSRMIVLVLLPMSLWFWSGWLLWAIVLRVTGSRHPDVPLSPGLEGKRRLVAAFALLMLILTVTLSPFPAKESSLLDFLKSVGTTSR